MEDGAGAKIADRIGGTHVGVGMEPDLNARKIAALDHIVKIIAAYLPPDSGQTAEGVVSDIIQTIEIRDVFRFVGVERQPPP